MFDNRNFILSLRWKKSNKIIFNMEKQFKRIKLHGKHRHRVILPNRDVPWLNINGLWLERAGFGIGQAVEIEVSEGRLIINAV
jgi:toxic protein SymE